MAQYFKLFYQTSRPETMVHWQRISFVWFSWETQFHDVLLLVAIQMDIGKLVGKPNKTHRVMSINRNPGKTTACLFCV